MEKEAAQFGVTPFSYDILDEEAAKISSLIAAVNKKCAGSAVDEVARDLFGWAEQMRDSGHLPEAEFLYLHAINIWQQHHQLTYPINFVSLREYARMLLCESDAKAAAAATVTELAPVVEQAA
jgi:hypothetical protein